MSGCRELMRRKLLEKMYDRLSSEEKRTFAQLTLQDKGREEILQALQRQDEKLDRIHKSQSWISDFGANIAGNAVFDGLVWIASHLFRKL